MDPIQFRENIKDVLANILKNPKDAANLEKGIYNRTLEIADEKILLKNGKMYILHRYILIN